MSSCREANERRVCHRAAETSRSHLPSVLIVLLSDLNNNNPDRVPFSMFHDDHSPPPPSTNSNAPTPGSNPAAMMSAVWEQCYDGYVITTAYLLFDSVRPLGVRITCFPHIQSILDSPSLTEFVSSGEQEKNGCFYFSAVPWQQHLHPLRAQFLALSFFPPPSLITSLSLDEAPPPHRFPSFSPACWL